VDSVLKQNKPSKNHCLSTLYRFQYSKLKVNPEEIVPTLPALPVSNTASDSATHSADALALRWLDVAVDVPLAALPAGMAFTDGVDYVWRGPAHEPAPQRGSVVLVTWARRRCLGVVLGVLEAPRYDPAKVLPAVLLPALTGYTLPEPVLKLAHFASQYYHRGIGEVLLPTISAALPAPKLPRAVADRIALAAKAERHALRVPPATPEQATVLSELGARSDFAVHVLYGVTGSGKSEVYFARASQAIAAGKQVLILVPEIVLVPAMVARVKKALPNANVLTLHSEIAPAQRRKAWAACLAGEVDVVVGTRLAVFAPLHTIGLIVVDEEHDPSYKQQEGVRYCARNLAVVRAQFEACPIILGSATPSLETWLKARDSKYHSHRMTQRAKASALPDWAQISLTEYPTNTGLSAPAIEALQDTLGRGEQSLVFLNRRGYAPVLTCTACGWASECPHCSSHMALHRLKGSWKLVCHHCAAQALPPKVCPDCGNAQLEPEGQGTQAIEQALRDAIPTARVARLDSDVTKKAGEGKRIAQAMADRELDILIGTQMTAKGHDFPALSTVIVVGCDGALFSPDYRGVERLFALLTQVSGRAGRAGVQGTVWLQTRQPNHPLFAALLQPSVDDFYSALLAERQQAGLPPYGYQAVLRASHAGLEAALAWLATAKRGLPLTEHPQVRVFSPVPMLMPKVATKFRAQLLFESASRAALHALLNHAVPQWVQDSKGLKVADAGHGVVWHLEVDPSEV
jgi:primosomal protein N' (replication factor Y) (superfamily II helicase)